MPRLRNYDYVLIYAHLHQLWENKRQGFSVISTRDQRYLHRFLRPSELLAEADLLAHRKAVTAQNASLPQQAGRALKHLANPLPLKQVPSGSRRIVVYPLLRPEPDIHRLALALIDTARRIAAEQARQRSEG